MTKEPCKPGTVCPMYMVTIQHAVAAGDLVEMKKVAAEAEAHLKSHGNVGAALAALRIEIAKLEP
jgi:hypothetical protein